MSRNHIEQGMITLHPAESLMDHTQELWAAVIGQTQTEELAVMVDTFKPLKITKQALAIDAGNYHTSWVE